MKEEKKSEMEKLVLAIRSSKDNRERNFLAGLEQKYGGKGSKSSKMEAEVETGKPKKKRKVNKA